MKPITKTTAVYLATKEEDEAFRRLLHDNGYRWYSGCSLLRASEWVQEDKKTKIHFVYPNGKVTYCGDKDNDTLTLQEFKDLYTEPNKEESDRLHAEAVETSRIASEQSHVNQLFDNILKSGFHNERRLNIATHILCAALSNPVRDGMKVERAFEIADALLAESQKGGNK